MSANVWDSFHWGVNSFEPRSELKTWPYNSLSYECKNGGILNGNSLSPHQKTESSFGTEKQPTDYNQCDNCSPKSKCSGNVGQNTEEFHIARNRKLLPTAERKHWNNSYMNIFSRHDASDEMCSSNMSSIKSFPINQPHHSQEFWTAHAANELYNSFFQKKDSMVQGFENDNKHNAIFGAGQTANSCTFLGKFLLFANN